MNEERLKERIIQFTNYLDKGKYDEAWEMLTQDTKTSINWTKASFQAFWKKQTRDYNKIIAYDFESIKLDKKNGKTVAMVIVETTVEITNKKGENVTDKRIGYHGLVFENNDWYISLIR